MRASERRRAAMRYCMSTATKLWTCSRWIGRSRSVHSVRRAGNLPSTEPRRVTRADAVGVRRGWGPAGIPARRRAGANLRAAQCAAAGGAGAGSSDLLFDRQSRRSGPGQPGQHVERRLRRDGRRRRGVRRARHAEPRLGAAPEDPPDHRHAGPLRRGQPLSRRPHLRPAGVQGSHRGDHHRAGPRARISGERGDRRRARRSAPRSAPAGARPVGQCGHPRRTARHHVHRPPRR